MKENKTMNDLNEKKNFIKDYITENECNYMCDNIVFECETCSCFVDCYMESCMRCSRYFADSATDDDYNAEDDFWEQF